MSLFGKTEVDQDMIPFIEKHEGVGIVKVGGYGKSSARIESYKLIFESYDDKNPIIESIAAINYLSYKKGNFFNEPKLEVGISHKKYILAGVDNNDDELESFYKKLLEIKNKEKEQKASLRRGNASINSNSSVKEITTDGVADTVEDTGYSIETTEPEDEKAIVDLEKEVINHDSESDVEVDEDNPDEIVEEEVVEESKPVKEVVETFDIEDGDDEDFEVLAEITEEEMSEEVEGDNNEDVVEDKKDIVEKEEIEEEAIDEVEIEEDVVEDEEIEEEEFEEIIIGGESDDSKIDSKPIVEEADDIEELQEEEIDLDRVINESEEENLEEEIKGDVAKDNLVKEEPPSDDSVEEDKKIEDDIQEAEKISQTDEKISQTSTENVKVTKENVNEEINQMKQQLSQNISDMQNVVPENQNFQQYIPTTRQADPVDQIRRYYELKEEGIITEEEFEQKKKQLLNL